MGKKLKTLQARLGCAVELDDVSNLVYRLDRIIASANYCERHGLKVDLNVTVAQLKSGILGRTQVEQMAYDHVLKGN